MASEPHSSPSNADTRIAPWASKWDALSEPPAVQPSPVPPRRADAPQAPPISTDIADADTQPAVRHAFASRLMAGISAVSFVLLAALIVICWPDLTRALG